jgi:hypothetical protein
MYRMTMQNLMKMRHIVDQGIIEDVIGNAGSQRLLEEEWLQLKDDRLQLRQTFPDGMSLACPYFGKNLQVRLCCCALYSGDVTDVK